MSVSREISRRQLLGHAFGAAVAGIGVPDYLRAQDGAKPATAPVSPSYIASLPSAT